MCQLCNLRGVFVADVRIKRGDKHEGFVHVLIDLLQIWQNAFGAVQIEGVHRVSKQAGGFQKAADQNRHENIELEITLRCGKADGGVVAHDLHTDHGERFTLGRVDLSRHD